MGRIAVRWSLSIARAPMIVTVSKEADGWYGVFSCADVPSQPLPRTRRETGIDESINSSGPCGRANGNH